MRALVLGGTGFIGSHLVRRLCADGHAVSILARPGAPTTRIADILPGIRMQVGDFHSPEQVAAAVAEADVVFHLIGTTLPATAADVAALEFENTVASTISLLACCSASAVGRIVFVSSGGTVYGIPKSLPIPEDHSLDPINIYGVAKLAVEKLIGVHHHQFGLPSVILRLANPYGPGQSTSSGQGVLSAWLHQLRADKPVEVWGDGSVVRDYLSVHDAVDAIVLASQEDSAPGIYNVGSGKGHSLLELAEIIESVTGRRLHLQLKPARKVDVPYNVLDIRKIAGKLGWQPRITLKQGIQELWSTAPDEA